MIITIDGPSGTGKSTVSRLLADELGFEHLDTGAFYRAFALHVSSKAKGQLNEKLVAKYLDSFDFQIFHKNQEVRYLLSNQDVTSDIRSPEISQLSSIISSFKSVRKEIVSRQREYAKKKNVVAEGRDLGSVVFPKAQIKFFLTADKEIRAKRRYQELVGKGQLDTNTTALSDVLRDISERDARDSTRSISPLICPEDAIILDTSMMGIEQVVQNLIDIYHCKIVKQNAFIKFFRSLFYNIVISSLKWFFRIFYRLKVYGKDNIESSGGIVASNHGSFFDPPILASSMPVELHFLAKAYLFKIPFLRIIIELLNAHPLKGGAGDIGVLKTVQKLIVQDKKIVIFPEGSRSKDGRIMPLKKGVASIALRAGSKIYPAFIEGANSIWGRDRKWPKIFGKIVVVFGKPLSSSHYIMLERKEAQDRLTEDLYKKLKDLEMWLAKGASGPIP